MSSQTPDPIKGRGASANPPSRFDEISVEANDELDPRDGRPILTRYYRDTTKTIIAYNDSPDVGFDASVNPYRGCEHGCVYCYARPTHEYLGFSAGLDFESKIMVKEKAAELLRQELSSKRWKPQTLAMSGVTDCYQPVERKLRLTRACLEVLLEFRNPVGMITKNHLVTRDVDILSRMAAFQGAAIHITVTTLDPELAAVLEPRASLPEFRLEAIRALSAAKVPVGVLVAPVIPGLTDHEMPAILAAAAAAGATFAGFVPLRLPFGLAPMFEQWLEQHRPAGKEKVLAGIRSFRDGKLNDSNFVSRMRGSGLLAEQLRQLFHVSCRKAGIHRERVELSAREFRVPSGPQLSLFY